MISNNLTNQGEKDSGKIQVHRTSESTDGDTSLSDL